MWSFLGRKADKYVMLSLKCCLNAVSSFSLSSLQDQLHPPDGTFPDAHADKGADGGVYPRFPQHHQPRVAAHVLHPGGAAAHLRGQRRDRPGRPEVRVSPHSVLNITSLCIRCFVCEWTPVSDCITTSDKHLTWSQSSASFVLHSCIGESSTGNLFLFISLCPLESTLCTTAASTAVTGWSSGCGTSCPVTSRLKRGPCSSRSYTAACFYTHTTLLCYALWYLIDVYKSSLKVFLP